MRLSHIEVAYFLGTTQINALKKIILIDEPNPDKAKHLLGMTKKQSVDSEAFDARYGTQVTFSANDLVNNCLKRSGFKKYLFHDWPLSILNQAKPPKVIQLPVPLRRLIKPADKEEIKRYWEQNYSMYVGSEWEKEYKLKFEP